MERKKSGLLRYTAFGGAAPVDPRWWLGNGAVPESNAYTVYDPFQAADLASSYINLANPGVRNANPIVAPTHSNGVGWTFNGTTQYLDTGILADAQSTVIIVCQSFAAATGFPYGVFQSPNWHTIRPNTGGLVAFTYGNNTQDVFTAINSGVFANSDEGHYLNGFKKTSVGTWSGGALTRSIFIGAINQGAPATYYNGRVLFFAHYNITLTDAQVRAVTNSIFNIVEEPVNAYANQVLATNPVFYLPMNNKANFTSFREKTGVVGGWGITGSGNTVTSGNAGQYGPSVDFPGILSNLIRPSENIPALMNADECSFAAWVYVDTVPGSGAVRFANFYTVGLLEYFVVELRPGGQLGIYQVENGVTSNVTSIVACPVGQWFHFVQYNSRSQNIRGLYVNGTKYESNRGALPGFANAIANFYPECFSTLDGRAQHLAFYNRALTQSEVNSLL